MREIERATVVNDFYGCNGSSVYRLSNGQVWQQSRYRYQYLYAYRPEARIFEDQGQYLLQVDGLTEPVFVRRAQLVEDGHIVSQFDGFKHDAEYCFQSGRKYRPAEHKYVYRYAHHPRAIVVDGVNGLELIVEGMDAHLRVRRA